MPFDVTFITSTGSRLDDDNLKLMRGHVTRENFLQRRRQKTLKKGHLPVPAHMAHSVVRDRSIIVACNSNSTSRKSVAISLPPEISSRQYPTTLIAYLMQVFKPVFSLQISRAYDNLDEGAWANLIFSDQAMLESSLCVAETHRSMLGQGDVNHETINLHKQNAIRIISQRLRDPSLKISDGTMNAVMGLAYSEQLSRNTTAWKTHITGLCEMVKIRQASDRASLPLFTELFCFASVNAAISATIESSQLQDQISCSQLSAKFEYLIYENTVRVEVLDIAQVIFHTQSILEAIRRSDKTDLMLQMSLDHQIKDVQCKLMSLSINSSYTQTLCIAITAFLYIIRPSTVVDNHIVPRLASKLMEALDSFKLRFRSSLSMVFWQYMVGAVATDESSVREWYMISMRNILPSLQLNSWEDAKKTLQKFFWAEDMFAGSCRGVWDESMTTRYMEVQIDVPLLL